MEVKMLMLAKYVEYFQERSGGDGVYKFLRKSG